MVLHARVPDPKITLNTLTHAVLTENCASVTRPSSDISGRGLGTTLQHMQYTTRGGPTGSDVTYNNEIPAPRIYHTRQRA